MTDEKPNLQDALDTMQRANPGIDIRATWANEAAYDDQARKLAGMFHENFAQYADQVTPEVRAAGFRNPG